MEVVHDRCAGLDVHKTTVVGCQVGRLVEPVGDLQGRLRAGRRARRHGDDRRRLVELPERRLQRGDRDLWHRSHLARVVGNGATWKPRQLLQGSTANANQRINDGPSIVWSSTRFVLFNAYTSNFSAYRILLTKGSGSP